MIRLVYNSFQDFDFAVSTNMNNVPREVPKEFKEKYEAEMKLYKDTQDQIRKMISKNKELLSYLKEKFNEDIKVIHPEYFL